MKVTARKDIYWQDMSKIFNSRNIKVFESGTNLAAYNTTFILSNSRVKNE